MNSPITGTSDTTLIRSLSPLEISSRWLATYAIDVGEDFRGVPKIEHWRCNATGFEWYEPAGCSGGAGLYVQLQQFDWYYMQEKWEFQAALTHFSRGERILEVGVGVGHFLSAARGCGLNVAGIETNPSAAKAARDKGFEIYVDELGRVADKLGPHYDGVCGFQVLEHVSDPLYFMLGALALLRPGGRLVLSVPNAAVARVVDPEHTDLLDQPPHHVSHWDAAVFRALEAHLPAKVRAVRREPLQSYHVDWFVSLVARHLHCKFGKWFGPLLVNRLSTSLSRWGLHGGLRNLVPGHTLLVVFEKTD